MDGLLYEALGLNVEKREMITIVGAGGKTTTMFRLAKELKTIGKRVLVTTTTAIFKPEKSCYDSLIIGSSIEDAIIKPKKGTVTVLGKSISPEGKLMGITSEIINRIFHMEIFDYILIEGDGSKRKPIKAPGSHEPVIPNKATITIGLIGLDSIGKAIKDENVHRAEIFCDITASTVGELIDCHKIVKLIQSPYGLFKGVPLGSKKFLILNKADTIARRTQGEWIKDYLIRENNNIDDIVIGCMSNY